MKPVLVFRHVPHEVLGTVGNWLSEALNCRELAELDYIDPQAIRAQTPGELPAMQAASALVFGRFAAMCRPHSSPP